MKTERKTYLNISTFSSALETYKFSMKYFSWAAEFVPVIGFRLEIAAILSESSKFMTIYKLWAIKSKWVGFFFSSSLFDISSSSEMMWVDVRACAWARVRRVVCICVRAHLVWFFILFYFRKHFYTFYCSSWGPRERERESEVPLCGSLAIRCVLLIHSIFFSLVEWVCMCLTAPYTHWCL